jgi:hypothetical protein
MDEGYDARAAPVSAIRPVGAGTVSPMELLSFTCPRCHSGVHERLYGPCSSCRGQLRSKYVIEGRVVELADYEPKMNVTPNAVALKDD